MSLVLITAGLSAGLIAVLATVCIEKMGGILGGVLATVPTTIIPASYMMWHNRLPSEFEVSMWVMPAGMLLNCLFLYLWKLLPKAHRIFRERPLVTTLVTLLAWGVGALWIRDLERSLPAAVLGLGSLAILIAVGLAGSWRLDHAPRGMVRVPGYILLSRGVLACLAVTTAGWIAQLGEGALASIASLFPAIFLTSMISIWKRQGFVVSAGAVAPMILGSSSICLFSIAMIWLTGPLEFTSAAVASWVLSVACTSLPAYYWLAWRRSARALSTHPA